MRLWQGKSQVNQARTVPAMSICIIGTGYVGLVTGVCLARLGNDVVCLDSDAGKIRSLAAGKVPFYEPGLEELMREITPGRLSFSAAPACLELAHYVFLAVGTPSLPGGEADLSSVFAAARTAAPRLARGAVVVLKSTVPAGTATRVASAISGAHPSARFSIVSNPEFLRQGSAVADFMAPDRIVVGYRDRAGRAAMEELYAPFIQRGIPIAFMSNEAAELTKYAANTYLALRIGLVNELADICEAVGADFSEVALGMGLDRRIGPHYLAPGPGFGGSCFPKDTRALARTSREAGVRFGLGEAIIAANEHRKLRLVHRVAQALGGSVAGKTIAILGLAFKAGTDDVRDSPSPPLISALAQQGARVRVHDPHVAPPALPGCGAVCRCEDASLAASGADALVIMTEWDEYRHLDLPEIAQRMRQPLLIDFRNLFSPATVAEAGFTYVSTGRPVIDPGPVVRPSPEARLIDETCG